MALIRCSECGRAVSDQAAACIGCGAPLPSSTNSAFTIAPLRSKSPALTRVQLRWRMLLAALTFIGGLLLTMHVDRQGGNRITATLAALLVISGLCWLIVAGLQNLMAWRQRQP